MALNIFKLLLITILIIGALNFAYADSGPTLGPNHVQKIAQDYLDSHNLPYTAANPYDRLKDLVMDPKTGKMEWIPNGDWDGFDEYVFGPQAVYEVPVTNNNGKNIGKIYVDVVGMEGTVIEVILLSTSKTDNFISPDGTPYSSNITNISIVTPITSQESSNTWFSDTDIMEETFYGITQLIIVFISGIIIGIFISAGYWKLSGR